MEKEGFLKTLREPVLQADPGSDLLTLRMVVEARASSIHSIRFSEKEDGTAKITISRLNKGHGHIGPHEFVRRWHRNISREQAKAFKSLVSRVDYWLLTTPEDLYMTWEEDALCMHASFFRFRAIQNEKAYDYAFSNCMLVTEGLQLMKALYELANITEKDEWSLAEYFADIWEKPEFENLMSAN